MHGEGQRESVYYWVRLKFMEELFVTLGYRTFRIPKTQEDEPKNQNKDDYLLSHPL
jgi:hypothetical protein